MRRLPLLAVLAALAATLLPVAPATATPVCTDGYMGGPPLAACGNRIWPEAKDAKSYVQYTANPAGFVEYQHGLEYMAKKYERWVSITTLAAKYGKQAVSTGPDGVRSYEAGDAGDGRDIPVIKLTDHSVPDKGKGTLFFSLSVHGNERGGLEGGLRTVEDLAMAATDGGKIADGIDNYESATGKKPTFHETEVREILAKKIVYLTDFNPDGWAVGDFFNAPPLPFSRTNESGTDLNRQMPTIGRIDPGRNPLTESEMLYGDKLMREVAAQGTDGRMDYGADIHGELTSQAYMDIMYPAGQFDSVDHRRLMAIAERTKSVIDATLYAGIVDQIEAQDGGNEQEGSGQGNIPSKPAHWATVWDTLGYTDTGFIGDYLATEVGVTGMDYEIFLNHTVPDKAWTVALQENHINATRGIIKTAIAYSLFQEEEFNERNVVIDPVGQPGYVANPDNVTDSDVDGPGAGFAGESQNGKPITQVPYSANNNVFFKDENKLMKKPFHALASGDIATDERALASVDTLVLADRAMPRDPRNRTVNDDAYFKAIKAWVEKGGNLVLTDRALHALTKLGLVPVGSVKDIKVYQPYADFAEGDLAHPMVKGLRPNARQTVEAATLGYSIGDTASPMTGVDTTAWKTAKGQTVAQTTRNDADPGGGNDPVTTVGEMPVGKGKVRIVGGALPSPTEENDHRYGLRDYALTYSGLYVMENAIQHDVPELGNVAPPAPPKPVLPRCTKAKTLTVKLPKSARKRLVVRVNGKKVKVKVVKGRPTVKLNLRKYRGKRVSLVAKKGKKTIQKRTFSVCR
jgi:hypothetical protein